MLSSWQEKLREVDFYKLEGRRDSLVRYRGLFKDYVFCDQDKFDKNRLYIYLAIGMLDQYQSEDREERDFILIQCRLLRDKVIEYAHYDDKRWNKTEGDIALKAFLAYGLDWFNEFGDPYRLIKYFEHDLPIKREKLEVSRKHGKLGMYRHSIRLYEWFFPSTRSSLVPLRFVPADHYNLSLLYDFVGDKEKTCYHAREYLSCIKNCKFETEPERTLKHLKALGCDET